jgi:hypothetical protein
VLPEHTRKIADSQRQDDVNEGYAALLDAGERAALALFLEYLPNMCKELDIDAASPNSVVECISECKKIVSTKGMAVATKRWYNQNDIVLCVTCVGIGVCCGGPHEQLRHCHHSRNN